MTDETRQAFAHPIERAKSSHADAADPLDRIMLRDHELEVEIGAYQEERGLSQRVRCNLVVEVASAADGDADDGDRILSYDALIEAIEIELAAERLNLLETLAARIADRVLAHPLARRCFIRIEKLDRGPFALGVEIVRSSPQAAPLRLAEDPAPHPRVVFLGNRALARPDISALLDGLEEGGAPVILCVGPPEGARPQAAHAMAQRRIDLLAIEQNAWVLAGRDRRCVVVDSRTELDWAMKRGQISVWAPSKLVLDAVEAPPGEAVAGAALALWFAGLFDACELVVIDAALPERGEVELPVRAWTP